MKSLKEIIQEAEKNKTAIGHFNISDWIGLQAIFGVALKLNLPVIIGVSEAEREFLGTQRAAISIKNLRERYNYPIFLNADHTHSLEKIKEAVEAGFDAVMFDGSQLPLEENIKKTKEIVGYVRSVNPEILVEAELGYIRGSSTLLSESVMVKEEDLTKPEEAVQFVKETGIDLLAVAVGNIHGIVASGNPKLNIERIKELKAISPVPLALHGGSGIPDNEISAAIEAGISVIHINTELRLAWRKGLEKALKEKPEEIAPYKILPEVIEEMKKVVEQKLRLFNKNN